MSEQEPFSEDEACLAHLHSMFNELAVEGCINESNLMVLCDNLCLELLFKRRLTTLLFGSKTSKFSTVTFKQFEEEFVNLLSDISGLEDDDNPIEIKDINENSTFIQDVPPRLVRHGKSYGRRSNPIESTDTGQENKNMISSTDNFVYKADNDVFNYSEPTEEDSNLLTLEMLDTSTSAQYIDMNRSIDVKPVTSVEEESGYININELLTLWKSKQVETPDEIIKSLGIEQTEKWVHMESLAELLEQKISHSKSIDALSRALITTYKHHIVHINNQREQAVQKMTKMRKDLVHSESRNTSLIAEAEDRFASKDDAQQQLMAEIEKKWSKRLQMTKLTFDQDRENMYKQWTEEREVLNSQINELTSREQSLLSLVEQNRFEMSTMEQEGNMLAEKLQMSEKNASRLKKDLECLLNKVDSSNPSITSTQEEKFAMIIKEYETHCRELSDRNDELMSALEDKTKLPQHIIHPDEGENVAFSIGEDEQNIKNISQRKESTTNLTEIKIAGLEKALKQIHNEKENIESLLNIQKGELEQEVSKLKTENQRLLSTNKNSVNQALSDAMKEKDELEQTLTSEIKVLKSQCTTHEKNMMNICQEFQQEKSVLTMQYKEQISGFENRISALEDNLSDKTKSLESIECQLKQEKERHLAAIAAHKLLVQNMNNEEIANTSHIDALLDERDAMWKKKEEEIKLSHIIELDNIRGRLQEKLNSVLVERDQMEMDRISLNSELDKVQSSAEEQKEMLQTEIEKMRKNFKSELDELNSLMKKEKDNLKQSMIDEGIRLEKEITLREKSKLQTQYDKMRKQEDHYSRLEELNNTLQATNSDLEKELEKVKQKLHKTSNQISDMKSKGKHMQKQEQLLQDKIDELLKDIKEQDNKEKDLNKRISSMHKEIARLEIQNHNISSREVESLLHEKEELAQKVSEIEAKYSHQQMENARLVAKNYHLTKSDNESAVLQEVHQRIEKKETENLKTEISKKIKMQRELEQKIEDLNASDNIAMKARLKKTREQLIAQIKKTKEVYKIVARNENLLKTLYCENADLMKALQITEQRQRDAERRSTIESDKNVALMLLLHQVCPDAM